MAQLGTIKLQTQNSGVVDVPVFDTGDSGSGIYEFVRVQTASGTGFIPVTDTSNAAYPYLRVQSQNNGIVAVTDTASAIPDSVVSRPNDDNSFTDTGKYGIRISVSQEWSQIDAEISANASSFETAYIYDIGDGSLMGTADISALTSGDVFTVNLDSNLKAGNDYNVVIDANGASMGHGTYTDPSFPYVSDDIEIVNGAEGETLTSTNANNIVRIGSI